MCARRSVRRVMRRDVDALTLNNAKPRYHSNRGRAIRIDCTFVCNARACTCSGQWTHGNVLHKTLTTTWCCSSFLLNKKNARKSAAKTVSAPDKDSPLFVCRVTDVIRSTRRRFLSSPVTQYPRANRYKLDTVACARTHPPGQWRHSHALPFC